MITCDVSNLLGTVSKKLKISVVEEGDRRHKLQWIERRAKREQDFVQ